MPRVTMYSYCTCIVIHSKIYNHCEKYNHSKSTILLYFKKRIYNVLPHDLHCITTKIHNISTIVKSFFSPVFCHEFGILQATGKICEQVVQLTHPLMDTNYLLGM